MILYLTLENIEMFTKLYSLTSPTCAGNIQQAVEQIMDAVKNPSVRAEISGLFLYMIHLAFILIFAVTPIHR
jgi:hypothetical protein